MNFLSLHIQVFLVIHELGNLNPLNKHLNTHIFCAKYSEFKAPAVSEQDGSALLQEKSVYDRMQCPCDMLGGYFLFCSYFENIATIACLLTCNTNSLREPLYYFIILCFLNTVFRRFLRYIPRQAFIVYRLIDAALIGIVFLDPFFFKLNFGKFCS